MRGYGRESLFFLLRPRPASVHYLHLFLRAWTRMCWQPLCAVAGLVNWEGAMNFILKPRRFPGAKDAKPATPDLRRVLQGSASATSLSGR